MDFPLKGKNGTILVVLAFIILYAAFLIISDLDKFSYQITKINFSYVIPILILGVMGMTIRAIRQKLFFDSLGLRISLKENIIIHFSGLSMTVTPGGLGQTIKSYFLKNKYNHPYTKTLSVGLAERYFELLGAVTIIAIVIFVKASLEGFLVVLIMGPILAATLVIVKNKTQFSKMISIIPKRGFLKKIQENHIDFFEYLQILTNKKLFFLGWILALSSWSFILVAFYLAFLAFDLQHDFVEVTIITFIPGVVGVISLLPGGIGLTEFGMLGLMIKYGIDVSVSSALILFIRFTTLWAYTIIGITATQYFIRRKSSNS